MLGRPTISRAARFAQSIRSRHSGRFAAASRVNLIFQRPEYRRILQQVLHRHSTVLSLRLALNRTAGDRHAAGPPGGNGPLAARPVFLQMTLQNWPELVSNHPQVNGVGVSAGRGEYPVTGQQVIQQGRFVQLASRRTIPSATSHSRLPLPVPSIAGDTRAAAETGRIMLAVEPAVAQRMMTRGQRMPMTMARTVAGRASGESAALPAARPVPRVVHVPQKATPPQAPPERDPFGQSPSFLGHGERSQIGSPHAPGRAGEIHTSRTQELKHHEIHQLADQVVQIIDGRIVARRERMGRI